MKQALTILILLLLIITGCKNDDDSTVPVSNDKITFIWQGFYHDWTYNHRVNRMGDWISGVDFSNGFKANFNHSAASGIGADELLFTTFATAVKTAANVQFIAGVETAVLQGIEGSTDEVIIPVQAIFEGQIHDEVDVLMNGFDMFSRPQGSPDLVGDGQADKLFHFSVYLLNVSTSFVGSKTVVDFDLSIKLGADCTSPECSSGPVNDFFDYQVSVAYQVLAGTGDALQISQETNPRLTYSWDGPMNNGANEILREDYTLDENEINGPSGFDLGLVGISSLFFQTEKGFGGFDGNSLQYPHMLNFDIALYNQAYDPTSGDMTFTTDLFFKNWTAPIPPVSFGGGGAATIVLGAKLVQIADPEGIVEAVTYENSIVWLTNPFNPAPPTNAASLSVLPVDLVLE